MRYQVETRASITKVDPQVPHVIISITDTREDFFDVPANDQCLDVLQLAFHDIDVPKSGFTEFSDSQALQVLNFYEAYRDRAQLVIAHCTAGQCRSPAVLAALQKLSEGDDNVWFTTKRPNRLVYRKILEAYHGRNR